MVTSAEPLRFVSLGDAVVPDVLADDLRRVVTLEAPSEEFASLLWLVLGESVAAELEDQLESFALRYGMERDALRQTLRAHRFMIREASRREVAPPDYGEDLRRLGRNENEADRLQSWLLPVFTPAMKRLEEERVVGAIADHGHVLVGVRWRVDSMLASDRGSAETKRVGLLTLDLREGGRRRQVTMQVLPDMLASLASACRAMTET
ncbi:MAG: hypothetical protein AAGN82_08165 [Myxococcota bacterium]